jgi:hypothetical protein
MSHYLTVQAVRIKIEPVVSALVTHAELGVFVNGDDTQEIRWSEVPLVGVSETWTSGVIAKNGIGDVEHKGDTRKGGSPEEHSGFDLKVLNNNQLTLRLKELGISVNGLKAMLYDYIGTEADSDASGIETRAVGTCEYEDGSTWDENIWNITIKSNRYQRNSFVGTQINNDPDTGNYPDADDSIAGKIVPITIGEFKQNTDGGLHPAKLLRTAGKEVQLTNSAGSSARVITPENLLSFPVLCNFIGYAQGTSGTGNPTVRYVGCGDLLAAGDVVTIYNYDFESTTRTVSSVVADTQGFAVTFTQDLLWTGNAYIVRLHTSDETESPNLAYVLQLGTGNSNNITNGHYADNYTDNWIESFVDKWIQIDVGGAYDGSTSTSLTGKYNKITRFNIMIDNSGLVYVTVILGNYFEKNLSCHPEATATNQAWVSVWYIPFEFTLDTWKCAGFIDENSAATTTPHLYSYISSDSFREKTTYELDDVGTALISKTTIAPVGFKRISQYGYTIDDSADNNLIIINALLFKNSPENLLSYDIFPMKTFSKFLEANLDKWGISQNQIASGYPLYGEASGGVYSYVESNEGGSNPEFDKNDESYLKMYYSLEDTTGNLKVYNCHVAEIDFDKIEMEYDSYYLGIDLFSWAKWANANTLTSAVFIKWRRFLGNSYYLLSEPIGQKYDNVPSVFPIVDRTSAGNIITLPDFYYETRSIPDKNEAFYFEIDTSDSQLRKISGKNIFQLTDISSVNSLKSIKEILFAVYNKDINYGPSHIITACEQLYELALICECSASISTEVYALCKGRIFDDTWGSRKTTTDLISNPVDVLEHWKRLQCGIDLGDIVNYGKAYSPSIPIKTGAATIGSYDDSTLDNTKALSVAYQIHDDNDAWTDTQIKNICKTFGLCTYTDLEGNECVTTLEKIGDTHTLTEITFDEIYPGSIGETQEAEAQDVYCQPIFNYMYNYGSSSYDKQLSVTNIQAATWNSAYTLGFDPTGHNLDATITDGQMVWNACKTNYNKYRQIEECSSDFSDQEMIADYIVAVKILYQKILWMGKARVPFSVYYDTGKECHYGQHIKIKLPHQTNNYSIECFIEKVKKSKYNNKVDLTCVLLEDVPTLFF